MWTCPKAPSPASFAHWVGDAPPNLLTWCASLVDVTLPFWGLSYGSLRPLSEDFVVVLLLWQTPVCPLRLLLLLLLLHLVCECVCVYSCVHICMSMT